MTYQGVLFYLIANTTFQISNLYLVGAAVLVLSNSTLYTNNTLATTRAVISAQYGGTLRISHNLELQQRMFSQY